MRTSLAGLFALSILFAAGCRKEQQPATAAPGGDSNAVAGDSNQAFTPPEIRRTLDSLDTGIVAAPAAPAPAAPAPTPAPAPVPAIVVPAPPPPPVKTVSVTPSADAPVPGESGGWVVQVGIHKSEEGARAMIGKLSAKGIPAYVVQAAQNAGLSGSYWRVRVGRFGARGDAQKYGDLVLKPAGCSFWIDRKSNEAPAAGGNP